MNYTLNRPKGQEAKTSTWSALARLVPLMKQETRQLVIALGAVLVNTASNLVAPAIIAHAVDTYIRDKDFHGVVVSSLILFVIYLIGLYTSYTQTMTMGGVGRRVLYNLRNAIFLKLQQLPVAFFNQNKAGDLISRINNDTDKLNMFFAQGLVQIFSNLFMMLGAATFLLVLSPRLGFAALLPAFGVLIVAQFIGGWVKRKNLESLQSLGGLSAEISESLANFKVIVAFNRQDYFRTKFQEANAKNFKASVGAGIANNVFLPIYTLASSIAQLIVLGYGIVLISHNLITIGLVIGFLIYVNNFYMPLRQIAQSWSTLQQALAALDRISDVMAMEPDMGTVEAGEKESSALLELKNVTFRYPDSADVLSRVNLTLEAGKTYALVGPTGGGKTTTASLMARLYDPTEGRVLLDGKDIRSFSSEERARRIGFILQEPFLFSGSLLDNIFYGNPEYLHASSEEKIKAIEKAGLHTLLGHFEKGLETQIQTSGETISLGQRQLIAFVRAVLRKPELLILDEATANIDTVTEQLLEDVLSKLPSSTTKVIIAHRLNTIENADVIYFVNGGTVTHAGSLQQAVDMLMHGKRQS